jgi:hypothetical protein
MAKSFSKGERTKYQRLVELGGEGDGEGSRIRGRDIRRSGKREGKLGEMDSRTCQRPEMGGGPRGYMEVTLTETTSSGGYGSRSGHFL